MTVLYGLEGIMNTALQNLKADVGSYETWDYYMMGHLLREAERRGVSRHGVYTDAHYTNRMLHELEQEFEQAVAEGRGMQSAYDSMLIYSLTRAIDNHRGVS